MAAVELSQQYLPKLLCQSHVNDDLCHNLISFNGVTVKIKEGLPGLGSKLNSKGYRRCANTAHPAITAMRASVFTPGEPGAGNRGALPVTE